MAGRALGGHGRSVAPPAVAVRVRDIGRHERVRVRYVFLPVAVLGAVAVFAGFVADGTFGVMICVNGLGKPGDLVQRRAPAVRRE
jgi:hypothetical protein